MKNIIFIVDDSISNLTMASEALSPHYAVMTIPTGEKALTLLSKVKPSLILLDVEMPNMNGFDVLQQIKEREELKDIPVIFLTAKTDQETKINALEMGVVDFVSKPFQPSALLGKVKNHVGL